MPRVFIRAIASPQAASAEIVMAGCAIQSFTGTGLGYDARFLSMRGAHRAMAHSSSSKSCTARRMSI